MQRRIILLIALVVGAVAALQGPAPASETEGVAAPTLAGPAAGTLRTTEAGPGVVAGTYTAAGSHITFRSSATAASGTARLSVNGKSFRLTRDLAAGLATWTGGGTVLVPTDRQAAVGLVAAIDRQWIRAAAADGRSLTMERDLAARLAFLVAEAPLGTALTDQRVRQPAAGTEAAGGSGARTVAGALPVADPTRCITETANRVAAQRGVAATDANVALEATAACQVSDDNGIWYFPCTTANRTLCHDAGGHCWLCETIHTGPGSSECMGECGPGCNGLNIYTYDCGDHDRCGRAHGGSLNPWDSECGDEYWDADDDFIWGWPNC